MPTPSTDHGFSIVSEMISSFGKTYSERRAETISVSWIVDSTGIQYPGRESKTMRIAFSDLRRRDFSHMQIRDESSNQLPVSRIEEPIPGPKPESRPEALGYHYIVRRYCPIKGGLIRTFS